MAIGVAVGVSLALGLGYLGLADVGVAALCGRFCKLLYKADRLVYTLLKLHRLKLLTH